MYRTYFKETQPKSLNREVKVLSPNQGNGNRGQKTTRQGKHSCNCQCTGFLRGAGVVEEFRRLRNFSGTSLAKKPPERRAGNRRLKRCSTHFPCTWSLGSFRLKPLP